MKKIISIKRFIDDGVGMHQMSNREFDVWRRNLAKEVNRYGLNIKDADWNIAESPVDSVNFLDILFWIDENRKIQTDLYIKPIPEVICLLKVATQTMFAGIVYTQALRIRRIVSIDERLVVQLMH